MDLENRVFGFFLLCIDPSAFEYLLPGVEFTNIHLWEYAVEDVLSLHRERNCKGILAT